MPSEDHGDIDSYIVGDLTPDTVRLFEEHLAGCAECLEEVASLREMQEFLGAVPPEALLDGPPEGADLLLQRTLRQVRAEAASARGRSKALATAAAVVVAAAVLGAGVFVGRSAGDRQPVAAAPPTTPTAPAAPPTQPGTRFVSAVDPATRARLTVAVVPAAGWVKISAAVTGIPEGQRCRLMVVSRDGSRMQAGGWLVSAKGAAEGTTLEGSALIDPANVAAVVVENTGGQQFVKAAL